MLELMVGSTVASDVAGTTTLIGLWRDGPVWVAAAIVIAVIALFWRRRRR